MNKGSESKTHVKPAARDALAARRAAVVPTAHANLARGLRLLQQCPNTKKLPRVRESSLAPTGIRLVQALIAHASSRLPIYLGWGINS